MQTILGRLTASRALASVLLANLISLVVLNGLSLRTVDLLIVYPIAFASAAFVLAGAGVRRVQILYPKVTLLWALAFFGCLTVPRAAYLLEWIPGNVVLAQADDYGRLAELVSMTMTERYPLAHFANQDFLLSHYYAALFPMAFLKFAIPPMTLKDAIFAGNLLYHLLFVFSLAELAARWFPAPRAYATFLFLWSFFGGLDWLFYANVLFEHAEHWPRMVFGQIREISSFYTGLYWVVHHFMAFYSVLLILLFATALRFRTQRLKITVLGMLLIGAFYSSVFATFTAFILAPAQIWRLGKRAWRTRAFLWLTPMLLVPLFLYTNRVQKTSMVWAPVHLGTFLAPVVGSFAYVVSAVMIDLAGIPVVLFFVRNRFTARERALFWTSIAFLVSTGFIESIGFNNYSMRGMFLPTAVFFYLFARYCSHLVRRGVMLVVALSAITVVREVAYLTYQPLMFSSWYWSATGREAPPEAKALLRSEYAALARDRSVRYYVGEPGSKEGMHKYNAGKLVQLSVEAMHPAEYELLRNPRRSWFW
ncbi:MAG TPA: hypothetical protein VER03_22880 [Bryobacteraceae bacterium]|nr:hypothetical protein [Bryobacteraceae bacterium]